jgi:hypothetical protein
MIENGCSQYWNIADYLPVDAVLDYWCDGQGDDCRTAKKYALITACEDGSVEYSRSDGRTFNDPVMELIGRDILLIRKTSFEQWAKKSFDPAAKQALQTPYLDPNHKYYSKELALAVTSWLALYGDKGKFQPHKGHIDQIKAKLAGNGLSTNMVEQIATVVNPNKSGGAPATGY